MNSQTINHLNDVNKTFYETIAPSFSLTRQRPWDGWQRVWTHIETLDKNPLNVLDIGCGNGRFGVLCRQQLAPEVHLNYTGLDQDDHLLHFAQQNMAELENVSSTLQNIDIIDALRNKQPFASSLFNLIAVFGVFHHIPSKELRQSLFNTIDQQLESGGTAVVTFWQFDHNEALMQRKVSAQSVGIDEKELEDGDYFLTWERDQFAVRYCHLMSLEEQAELLKNTHLQRIDTFEADGKTGKENRYIILRKD